MISIITIYINAAVIMTMAIVVIKTFTHYMSCKQLLISLATYF